MVSIKRIARDLRRVRTGALVLALGGLLGACASLTPEDPAATRLAYNTPAPHTQSSHQSGYQITPPATPGPQAHANNTTGGRYKVGAPYQQGGVWYVPAEQPNYDEVGLASWYGDAFNGKKTANGEMFDMNALSAAHATLPMPCIVEVTNLDNGRVMQVRLNDRGPYHPGRIIDLSHAAAKQLGYDIKGTTRVRVRYVGPAPLDGVAAPFTVAAGPRLPPQFVEPQRPTYQIVPPSQPVRPVAEMAGGYVVQAGAFSSRATADQVAAQLAAAGSTRVKPLDRNGATLYRVVVGPWSDDGAAQAARNRVMALGFNDAKVASGF